MATSIVSGAPVPEAVPDVIIPVSVSTPNAEGSVFHDVKFGQTLWQIAITYEVKIDDIKRLNNLLDNNIYPGSTLLIKQEVIISTSLPTEAMTEAATSTSLPTMTVTAQPVRSTPGAEVQSISTDNTTLLNVMIGIIALAVVGGGIVAWIGSARSKRTPNS
jgi:LysM repeat protein